MFSGIIEYLGTVANVAPMGRGKRMVIEAGPLVQETRPGDSLAVNGACLTVTETRENVLEVEAVTETLSKTNLGKLSRGSRVNLERPLKAQGRVHGHWVLGHIDSTTRVAAVKKLPESVLMSFEMNDDISKYIVNRGSVAVDGVSLTVARLENNCFVCSLIGFTLSHTNLATRKTGHIVNIETDILGKYVVSTIEKMRNSGERITPDKLHRWGY